MPNALWYTDMIFGLEVYNQWRNFGLKSGVPSSRYSYKVGSVPNSKTWGV